MRTCGNCGAELADDARFCSRCGTAASAPGPTDAEGPPPAEHPAAPAAFPPGVVVDPPTAPAPSWPAWTAYDDTEPAPRSYPATEPVAAVSPPTAPPDPHPAPGPYAAPPAGPPAFSAPPPPLPAPSAPDDRDHWPPRPATAVPPPPAPVSHDPYFHDATTSYRLGGPGPLAEPPYAPVGPPLGYAPPPVPGAPAGHGVDERPAKPKRRTGLVIAAVVLVAALVAAGIVLVTRDDDGDGAGGGGGRPAGELAWGQNVGDAPISFVDATGDGPIVVAADATGDANPQIVGLAASDGSERWRYEADDEGGGLILGRAEGLIVATASDGQVVALDEASGEATWTADAGADLLTIVAGGRVVVAEGGGVRALSLDDGSEAWAHDVDGGSLLDGDDGHVLVVDGDGEITALAIGDGSERWTYDSGGPSVEAQIHDGDVFVAAGDPDAGRGQVSRVDVDSGEAAWEERVDGDPFFGGADGDVAVFFWDDLDSGAVVAAAYAVESGDRAWRGEIGSDQSATVVAVEDGRVVVTSPGEVVVVGAADGDRVWRESVGGDEEPLAGLRGGVVYVADDERILEGYALEDGERTLRFESSARVNDLDVRGGRAFVASDDGAVYGVR